MNQQRLDEIRARCNAATDGPWGWVDDGSGNGAAWVAHGLILDREQAAGVNVWMGQDADFIAHARDDVPDLLAEVERLRAERRWVSVEERLPDTPPVEPMIVWLEPTETDEGKRAGVTTAWWMGTGWLGEPDGWRVTNWMLPPDPPTDEPGLDDGPEEW